MIKTIKMNEITKTKCINCQHISVVGKWDYGKLIGRIYSCDKNMTDKSESMIEKNNCSEYLKHPNLTILSKYLLGIRVNK